MELRARKARMPMVIPHLAPCSPWPASRPSNPSYDLANSIRARTMRARYSSYLTKAAAFKFPAKGTKWSRRLRWCFITAGFGAEKLVVRTAISLKKPATGGFECIRVFDACRRPGRNPDNKGQCVIVEVAGDLPTTRCWEIYTGHDEFIIIGPSRASFSIC